MKKNVVLYSAFLCVVFLNIALWFYARDERAAWGNVPPVPAIDKAEAFTLGDKEAAYRGFALMLQNLGESGGRSEKLVNYDYARLGQWFFLEDSLNRTSDYVPLLAAFYYGATQKKEDLDPVIDYLAFVGMRTEGEKWRWLAQAVYLSRFVQRDTDKALNLAYSLASHPNQDRPGWTYQMPAFVLNDIGDKEAASRLLLSLLAERGDKLDPAEVNFTKEYICERIFNDKERKKYPLCSGQAPTDGIE